MCGAQQEHEVGAVEEELLHELHTGKEALHGVVGYGLVELLGEECGMTPKQHQVLFINGPPNSGKDTAAEFIWLEYQARRMEFKWPLAHATKGLFDLTDQEVKYYSSRGVKDKGQDRLCGMSWRQALIWISEECVKPTLGDTFFGMVLAERLKRPTMAQLTVIPDSGFEAEAEPIIHVMGAKNCHLFHIHRPGCSFDRDSRSYWTSELLPMGNIHEIKNEHELSMYKLQILSRVDRILGLEVERK